MKVSPILLTAAALVSFGASVPAFAQSPDSGEVYRMIDQASGLVAVVKNSSTTINASVVLEKTDYSSLGQRWALSELSGGYWEVTDVNSGLCLAAVDATDNVIQNAYTGNSLQQWQLTPTTNGYYTLSCKANGLLLDVKEASAKSGARLVLTVPGDSPTPPPTQQWLLRPSFFHGGDLTFAENEESDRAADGLPGWQDDYAQQDIFQMFKDHGINLIRCDWFVQPVQGSIPIPNAMSLDIARRAKALGLSLELTIEVTDTWASSQPPIPLAWQSDTYAQLKQQVRSYCKQTIETFRQNGVMPDIVTIGNEVNLGWLDPAGTWYNNSPYGGGPSSGLARFEQLQTAAMLGVREGSSDTSIGTALPAPLCGIHYAGSSGLDDWFSQFDGGLIPYEVICESYYPFYHGPLFSWQANPNGQTYDQSEVIQTADDLGKPIFNIECGEHAGPNAIESPDPWFDPTPAGQRQFLIDLVSVQDTIPSNLGMGACYWEPEAVRIPGWVDVNYWDWYENSLFNEGTGTSDPNWSNLLPGIDGLGGRLDPNLRYELVNTADSQVAGVYQSNPAIGSRISLAANNGHPTLFRQWMIQSNGDGYFELQNSADAYALDNNGSSKSGAPIVQEPVNGDANQEWDVVSVGGGNYDIVNRANGDVVDVRGSYLVQELAVSGTLSQEWQIVAAYSGSSGYSPIPNGVYVVTGVGSGSALDDPGSSTAPGTQMDISTATGGANQNWTLSNLGNDVVDLINGASGMALETASGSTSNGAAVDQAPYTGATYQQWWVVPVSPGIYSLKNLNSGQFLDVVGAGTANGAPIDQWPSNGGSNQEWMF
jgi:arabinogalactan endo-1,4-beta-galactosidase